MQDPPCVEDAGGPPPGGTFTATEHGYRARPASTAIEHSYGGLLKNKSLRSPSAATGPSDAVYGPIPRKTYMILLRGRKSVSGRMRASQQLRAAG